jgi:hypothetical protein
MVMIFMATDPSLTIVRRLGLIASNAKWLMFNVIESGALYGFAGMGNESLERRRVWIGC